MYGLPKNVCCACVHLDVPSICFLFMCVYVGGNLLIQEFKSWIMFLCVILHIMWSGKSLQLLCILPFDIL